MILNGCKRLPRGRKPFLCRRIFHLQEKDSGIFRAADASESRQLILFAVAQFAVDHNNSFCAVVPGINRFRDQLRVFGQASVAAFCRKSRGFVTEHDHDFVFHIEMRVIVIAEFRRGRSVSRKHDGAADFSRRRKAERDEILTQFQFLLCSAIHNFQPIVFLQLCASNYRERLKVRIPSRRLQSQGAKSLLDQVCR